MNIGLCYKKQGLYKKAFDYYEKALDYYGSNKVKKSVVFNNMAETYNCMQQLEEALSSINKAFDCLGANSLEKLFVYHQTYAQIVEQMGQYEKALDKLFHILNNVNDGFVHRKYIINGINNMIKIVKKYNNEVALRDIEKVLIMLLRTTNSDNVEFIRELKSCIGEIYIHFRGLDF
jgi:tetratricopeptide (TPR) repeat protein